MTLISEKLTCLFLLMCIVSHIALGPEKLCMYVENLQ